MSNLLVVDFDFFFPNPMEAGDTEHPFWQAFDWGHAETPMFLSPVVWISRASTFLSSNVPLPSVTPPEGGWTAFWDRFSFEQDAEFTFADSNAYAGLIEPPDGASAFDEVVLFDAHHDSGYRIDTYADYLTQNGFTCEDWLLEHQHNGTSDLTVRYPAWKQRGVKEKLPKGVKTRQMIDDGKPVETVFDTVFVCRSGAWVPSWCDRDFLAFVDACPLPGEQVDDTPLDRRFDQKEAEALGAQMRAAWDRLDPAAQEPV